MNIRCLLLLALFRCVNFSNCCSFTPRHPSSHYCDSDYVISILVKDSKEVYLFKNGSFKEKESTNSIREKNFFDYNQPFFKARNIRVEALVLSSKNKENKLPIEDEPVMSHKNNNYQNRDDKEIYPNNYYDTSKNLAKDDDQDLHQLLKITKAKVKKSKIKERKTRIRKSQKTEPQLKLEPHLFNRKNINISNVKIVKVKTPPPPIVEKKQDFGDNKNMINNRIPNKSYHFIKSSEQNLQKRPSETTLEKNRQIFTDLWSQNDKRIERGIPMLQYTIDVTEVFKENKSFNKNYLYTPLSSAECGIEILPKNSKHVVMGTLIGESLVVKLFDYIFDLSKLNKFEATMMTKTMKEEKGQNLDACQRCRVRICTTPCTKALDECVWRNVRNLSSHKLLFFYCAPYNKSACQWKSYLKPKEVTK